MLPRLGEKYELDIDTVSRSREEYQSDAHQVLGLPAAPAVLVADELAGQGPELSEEKVEALIRRHLLLPA